MAARPHARQHLESYEGTPANIELERTDSRQLLLDSDKESLPAEASAQAGVEPRYKVRLIEEEFKQLTFEVKDV